LPDPQDALGLRYLHPELEVMAIGVRGRRVPAHRHPRSTFSRVIGRHEALSLDRRADSLLQRYSAFACPSRQLRTCSKAKVWAVADESSRPSKRQKDLADIARILEVRPDLRSRVPNAILERLF
jgi:hypothetical protein